MSQQPLYTPRPIEESMHPLEEVMRLIGRDAPRPFYPAEYLSRSRVNPDHFSSILDHLALEGLIAKVPARSLESGAGVVLTKLGEQVLAEPAMMTRLVRGDVLREGDVGAMIRKGMRTRVKPYATYAIIAANVLVFLLGWMNPADWSQGDYRQNAVTKELIEVQPPGKYFAAFVGSSGKISAGQWWRLLTCTFLHAGLMHLGFNMFSLYSVGAFVEQAWGRWRFLIVYFLSGWVGSCVAVYFGSSLIGASGAVCGVLGAVGIWFLLYGKHIPREFARRGLRQVIISIVLMAGFGLAVNYFSRQVGLPFQISNAAHFGGLFGGAAAALILHVQRYGLPGMRSKAEALRWAISVPLLLMLVILTYLPTQKAHGDRGEAKEEVKPERDLLRKGEKLDEAEGAAFYKAFGEGLTNDVILAHGHLFTLPNRAEKAAFERKLATIAEDREKLAALKAKLEEARYDNRPVERMRKEGIFFVERLFELMDMAKEYLEDPNDAARKKLNARYNAFVDPYEDYCEKLKKLAP